MQTCPICKKIVSTNLRYDNYICEDCIKRAKTENGELVLFNTDIYGNITSYIKNSGIKYNSNICYIDGIKCIVSENRFGGIIINIYI